MKLATDAGSVGTWILCWPVILRCRRSFSSTAIKSRPVTPGRKASSVYRRMMQYGASGPQIRLVIFSWPSATSGPAVARRAREGGADRPGRLPIGLARRPDAGRDADLAGWFQLWRPHHHGRLAHSRRRQLGTPRAERASQSESPADERGVAAGWLACALARRRPVSRPRHDASRIKCFWSTTAAIRRCGSITWHSRAGHRPSACAARRASPRPSAPRSPCAT